MELQDFAGEWLLDRWIGDRLGGACGWLTGRAWLRPCAGGGFEYVETGQLCLAGASPVAASRRYLWRCGGGGRVAVAFEDGRPFHVFSAAEATPRAEHRCPPDHYAAEYDFRAWPRWRLCWEVRGPRKAYRLESRFRPAGQAG